MIFRKVIPILTVLTTPVVFYKSTLQNLGIENYKPLSTTRMEAFLDTLNVEIGSQMSEEYSLAKVALAFHKCIEGHVFVNPKSLFHILSRALLVPMYSYFNAH